MDEASDGRPLPRPPIVSKPSTPRAWGRAGRILLVVGPILGAVALAFLVMQAGVSGSRIAGAADAVKSAGAVPRPGAKSAVAISRPGWPSLPLPAPDPDSPRLGGGSPSQPSLQLPPFSSYRSIVLVAALVVFVLAVRRLSRRSSARGQPKPANLDAHPQVFVSYSRLDGKIVDRVVKEIEQAGYPVWIDRELSHGAQRYAAPIVRAIKSSKLIALMCSRNAFQSDHVIRELYVAGDYKKPFIAFQLDQSEFPDEVQYFVSGFPRLPVGSLSGVGPVRDSKAGRELNQHASSPAP